MQRHRAAGADGYDTLSRAQARLLLGAIISDTFSLTSPTTTARDRAAVHALLPRADLALEPFAQTLLERRTQLGDAPMTELLAADEKAYQIAGYQLYVSQICVMDPAQLHSRQAELEQAMQERLMQDELDAYVLMLTDLAKGAASSTSPATAFCPSSQRIWLVPSAARKRAALADPLSLRRAALTPGGGSASAGSPPLLFSAPLHVCLTGPFTALPGQATHVLLTLLPPRIPFSRQNPVFLHFPFNSVCYDDVNEHGLAMHHRHEVTPAAQRARFVLCDT